MALMGEKADLLDQLQEQENVIVRLSGETETIGKCLLDSLLYHNVIMASIHLSNHLYPSTVQESTSHCTSCSVRPSEESSKKRTGSFSS